MFQAFYIANKLLITQGINARYFSLQLLLNVVNSQKLFVYKLIMMALILARKKRCLISNLIVLFPFG
jgi:hypothetical protein